MGDFPGHPFRGNQWVLGGDWQEGNQHATREERVHHLSKIEKDVRAIREELDKHLDLFSKASIVGSFAEQNLTRLPDRGGKTSDIDLMVEPRGGPSKRSSKHWDVLSKIQIESRKRGREVNPNLEPAIGRCGGH